MKLNGRYVYALVVLAVAVICAGLIIFAGLRSAAYQAPQQPVASQQSLKDQLAAGLTRREKQVAAVPKPAPSPQRPPSSEPTKPAAPKAPSKPAPATPAPSAPTQSHGPATTPAPQPAAPATPPSLVNTGPGSLLALFTVGLLAGSALHHRSLLKRAKQATTC